MTKKTIRCGIVGSGFAADLHFRSLLSVSCVNVELAGVYSPTPERREAFARERGIRASPSLESLLDGVEVVHVCSTAASHEAVAVAALERGKFPIVEKPLTGFFPEDGRTASKERALVEATASVGRMMVAERASTARILYAENWVYAPAVRKEREIIEKTGAQILWMRGEESHSGSHSPAYGYWRQSGGGSLIGKACHPLTAALFLKRVEGMTQRGSPILPATVSARVHEITRLKSYRDEGHLRTDYHDTEDFSTAHVVFEDGTVADIIASDIVLGGVHNRIEVAANNHRTICNINPNTAMQTYNPVDASFRDIYVVEKIGTKQGWSAPSPDEHWFAGYPQEVDAFYRTVAYDAPLDSDSSLAASCVTTVYAAYLSAECCGAETPVPALTDTEK